MHCCMHVAVQHLLLANLRCVVRASAASPGVGSLQGTLRVSVLVCVCQQCFCVYVWYEY